MARPLSLRTEVFGGFHNADAEEFFPQAIRLHAPEDKGGSERGYHVALRALKDKRRGPGWTRTTKLRGPPGL